MVFEFTRRKSVTFSIPQASTAYTQTLVVHLANVDEANNLVPGNGHFAHFDLDILPTKKARKFLFKTYGKVIASKNDNANVFQRCALQQQVTKVSTRWQCKQFTEKINQ